MYESVSDSKIVQNAAEPGSPAAEYLENKGIRSSQSTLARYAMGGNGPQYALTVHNSGQKIMYV